MSAQLKIGEFANFCGVTIKTVLYYHKIGLLPEPVRSAGGYRLYGWDDIKQMLAIKRMKSLGLSLDKIKDIIRSSIATRPAREVLLALQSEMLDQISRLQGQVARIQDLLDKEEPSLKEDQELSATFKMFTDILGEDAHAQYQNSCPELYEQERKLYGLIDELEWGLDFQDLLAEFADYFKEHPEQYQDLLDYGTRMTEIAKLPPDSPVIQDLACKYAAFLKSLPFFEKLIKQENWTNASLESISREMFADVMSPAQMKLMELLSGILMLPDDQPVKE